MSQLHACGLGCEQVPTLCSSCGAWSPRMLDEAASAAVALDLAEFSAHLCASQHPVMLLSL